MVDAFKAKNLLFAEAFMYRFHPQNKRAQQMVQDGAIGEAHIMDARFSFRINPGNEDAMINRALAFYHMKNFFGAAELLREVIKRNEKKRDGAQ